MEKRTCLYCKQLVVGRSDKKFCCASCRYEYNNQFRTDAEKPLQEVNQILRKNQSILKQLAPEGNSLVDKEVLLRMGYNFNHFTSIYITRQKQVYYICYTMAFTPILRGGAQKVLIVHKYEYIRNLDPWKFIKKENSPTSPDQ